MEEMKKAGWHRGEKNSPFRKCRSKLPVRGVKKLGGGGMHKKRRGGQRPPRGPGEEKFHNRKADAVKHRGKVFLRKREGVKKTNANWQLSTGKFPQYAGIGKKQPRGGAK